LAIGIIELMKGASRYVHLSEMKTAIKPASSDRKRTKIGGNYSITLASSRFAVDVDLFQPADAAGLRERGNKSE
jgi:hypothetical protein